MICSLVAAGKKVGITANSHKVIRNILDEVVKAPARRAANPLHPESAKKGARRRVCSLRPTTVRSSLGSPATAMLPAAQLWLWARADVAETVDVLFIDEAAQMSLANVLAVSQAAKASCSLATHGSSNSRAGQPPRGTDVSALDHILGEHATIPADRGLFLETWRLHPVICEFTSEMFYEGRLHSRPASTDRLSSRPDAFAATGYVTRR
jgi:uncharacterized protein